MRRRNQRPLTDETSRVKTLLATQQKQQEVSTTSTHRDVYCAAIFFLYVLAMIAIMGLCLYYGNYSTLRQVVDDNGKPCGIGDNAGFPFLLYPKPCQSELTKKVCVDQCFVDSATAPNMAPGSSCSTALTYVGTDTCGTITDCKFYQSFAYLQKICIPKDNITFPDVESNIVNNESYNVVLNNMSVTYPYLLGLGAAIVVLSLLSFCMFMLWQKVMYVYLAVTFFGLLFLAFYTMKFSKIAQTNNTFTTIVSTDQQKNQIISYIIFGFFIVTSPLVLFGYRRLGFSLKLAGSLKSFFRRSTSMHAFCLLIQLLAYVFFAFQVFVMCNLLTYGDINNSGSTSPFNKYSLGIVGTPIMVFQLIGTYWAFSFLVCYCQFVISCNMFIWYYEETTQFPAFSPLRRSLAKAAYHLGSIALDAFLIPFTWILLIIITLLRQEETEDQDSQSYNACTLFFLRIWRKFISFFQISQSYLNRGSYCSMANRNLNFFLSNKAYSSALTKKTKNMHSLGTIVFIFMTLFVVILSLLISYFVMQTQIVDKDNPHSISSLSVPLALILLLGLCVGGITGSTLNYAMDSFVYHHITAPLDTRMDPSRKAYEAEEFLNSL